MAVVNKVMSGYLSGKGVVNSWHIKVLRRCLNSSETLSDLLIDQTGSATRVLAEGSRWTRLPQFYAEPRPRASYRVEWADGTRFLVKLNTEARRIEREGSVCRLLRQREPSVYHIPPVLDMELETCTADGMTCGWLVTPWFEGVLAAGADEPDIVHRAAEALAALHAPPLDFGAIEGLFHVHIPPLAMLAGHIRERQLNDVRLAIQRVDGELASGLDEVERRLLVAPLNESLRLVHGDFHLNNILVVPRNGIRTPPLVILDWEDATVDNPLSDVAHLIALEGADVGRDFMVHYLDLASGWMSEDRITHAQQEIWQLAGVWSARFLKWRLTTARDEIERARVCREVTLNIQVFLSEIGQR
jgi:Ser/Thr protein kinase RdoA (MazF antagonist)